MCWSNAPRRTSTLRWRKAAVLVSLAVLVISDPTHAGAGGYQLSGAGPGNGGGYAEGGGYSLVGMLGQSESGGQASGGGYSLEGGFYGESTDDTVPIDPPGAPPVLNIRVAALYPPIPNPFNPTTRIVFDLPETNLVRLAVYGADGRIVRTLLHDRISAGRYVLRWDGRDDHFRSVASGTYFVRYQTATSIHHSKIILLR